LLALIGCKEPDDNTPPLPIPIPKPPSITGFADVELLLVSKGSFQMGKDLGTEFDDVTPVHTVTLTRDFYMGKYEVTQLQYKTVMGSLPSLLLVGGDYGQGNNYPVYFVNWYDALVFCNKLSILEGLTPVYSIEGKTDPAIWGAAPASNNDAWNFVEMVDGATGYRLPTEAQWEWAAKGGIKGEKYTYPGSDTANDVAWSRNTGGGSRTYNVGQKAPNGLGLYDMAGNVKEWCWDWYAGYTVWAQTDPAIILGLNCVTRGGGALGEVDGALRSVHRESFSPETRNYQTGFRVVRP